MLIAVLLALPVAALAATPQTVVLDMQNMTCSLCSITVQRALGKVPGVIDTKIYYHKKTVTVKYGPDKANTTALIKATTEGVSGEATPWSKAMILAAVLQSLLTCPHCRVGKQATMPTDACQFFYECEQCKAVLRPKPGDCCVFCSYGSVKCPSRCKAPA